MAVNISGLDNPATNFPSSDWNLGSFLTGGTGDLSLINLAFFVAGLAFFASLAMASFSFIFSDGAPDNISKANTRITWSLIGIIIVFSSFVIVRIVVNLFDFQATIPIT